MQFNLDLNLLHQYLQTQPVASKDRTKKLYSQTRYLEEATPDPKGNKITTQMYRFATRGSQKSYKITQLSIRLVPRGSQEDAPDTKSPQSDSTEASTGAMWLPKVLPRDPKDIPNEPKPEKTGCNRIIFIRKSRIWSHKHQTHYLFAFPWVVIFGVFCENHQKH